MERVRRSALAFGVLTLMNICAQAQSNPWVVIVERVGRDAFCNGRGVTGGLKDPKPASQDERFLLYLRCEAKGGRDEFVKRSCCDHLTTNDARNIGICPDNPVDVVVPIRDTFKSLVSC